MVGSGMWWIAGIVIGGYLLFVAWKLIEALGYLGFLIVRDTLKKYTDRES
jgi:hypothetical protein